VIFPSRPQSAADVARHYDELDVPYRRIWGEHVHHGYWRTGRESSAEAAEALVHLVAERLAPQPGERGLDIGCGYGATAGWLAEHHGMEVTGFTLSEAQAAVGRARPGFTCLVRDWLDNGQPDAAFDRAYAIESSEHMVDKARFFTEARRVLRPDTCLNPSAAKDDYRAWAADPTTKRSPVPPASASSATRTSAARCARPGRSACAASSAAS
jgi:tocopherol O-methyltransferase